MKTRLILQEIEHIKESVKNIDERLFAEGKKEEFLKVFCETWVYPSLETIKKEVLK